MICARLVNYIIAGYSADCHFKKLRVGKLADSERDICFSERDISISERYISFPERRISFSERDISFPERWDDENVVL
jgi:hypothetical protein